MKIFFTLFLFTGLLFMQSCQQADSHKAIPILDCHVHLWDTNKPETVSWPRKEHTHLYKPHLPEHFRAVAEPSGVRGTILVLSGQALSANQWNLDIIKQDREFFNGVVGNLSKVIATDEFKPLFEKLCKDEYYLGYRLSGRYKEGLTEELFKNFELTASKGKTVDFLVGGYSPDDIMKIAKRFPNLKIIVDHFSGVRLNKQPLDPTWVNKYKEYGQYKNIYCKVSALYGRFKEQPAPKEIKYYKEVLDLTMECFGEDRIIYGSDWPVTKSSGDYQSVVDLTKQYFDKQPRRVQEKLYYKNAVEFYGAINFNQY